MNMNMIIKKLLAVGVITLLPLHAPLYGALRYDRYRARESFCTRVCRYFIKDRETLNAELREAIETNDKERAKSLIRSYAQVHTKDEEENTPLIVAAKASAVRVLPLILAMKAEVNEQGEDRRTALHQAVKRKNIQAVRILLEAGADVAVQDNKGNTPLHMAVMEGDLTIVSELLQVAPPVVFKIKNRAMESVLDCASENEELAELIEETCAKQNKSLKKRNKEEEEKAKTTQSLTRLESSVHDLWQTIEHQDNTFNLKLEHHKEITDRAFQSVGKEIVIRSRNQEKRVDTLAHTTEHRIDKVENRQAEDRISAYTQISSVAQQSKNDNQRFVDQAREDRAERIKAEDNIKQTFQKNLQSTEKRVQKNLQSTEERVTTQIKENRDYTVRELRRLDKKQNKSKKGQMLNKVINSIPVVGPVVGPVAEALNLGGIVLETGEKALQFVSGDK